MQIRKGVPASPGICIAEAFLLDTEAYFVPKHFSGKKNVSSEISRLEKAISEAVEDFHLLRDRLSDNIKERTGPIIEAQIQMLQDKHIHDQVVAQVKNNGYTPEYAVTHVLKKYAKALIAADDNFLASRVQDIYGIERKLLQKLLKKREDDLGHLKKDAVIIAHDLTPAQTVSLDKKKVRGFATDAGGPTSHTAIIARSLGIPAVVGLGTITFDVAGGDTVIIDGNNGMVIIDPDEETVKKYVAKERNFIFFEKQLLKESKTQPTETKDGYKVDLYANVDLPSEIPVALKYGCSGVGLLRTEFLYPSVHNLPSEKKQSEIYKKITSQMGDKEVVIRTLDIGADKLPVEGAIKERNPFLGCRAIRFSLQHQDIFKTQLRAILRATNFGNISIMFPMISSYDEVIQAKNILNDVKGELASKKVRFNKDIKLGLMIEVPSAALISDVLIKEVDFCSIGTNDLIQYTLAVDRGNQKVVSLYQPAHPGVLRLVKGVIDAGQKHGKTVAMCGEMSGNVIYTVLLLGLGLKLFSMVPVMIPEVKKIIRSVNFSDAQKIAEEVMNFGDGQSATAYLRDYTKSIVPQLF